jgi:hypothetical protein
MNALEVINALVVIIGIPTLAGALLFIGRKLQVLDSVEASTEKTKHNLKVVCDFLTRHQLAFDPRELHTMSPLQLTDDGKKFLKEIGFENTFAQNKQHFFSYIDQQTPKLKYDVEIAAMQSIYAAHDAPYMAFLKVFFYNNPKRNLENTAPTLGILVRDAYLNAHPEITE